MLACHPPGLVLRRHQPHRPGYTLSTRQSWEKYFCSGRALPSLRDQGQLFLWGLRGTLTLSYSLGYSDLRSGGSGHVVGVRWAAPHPWSNFPIPPLPTATLREFLTASLMRTCVPQGGFPGSMNPPDALTHLCLSHSSS